MTNAAIDPARTELPAIADRITAMPLSQIARLIGAVAERRSQGLEVLSLGAGEPSEPTPAHIIEAAHQAMLNGQTRYTVVDGTAELKTAIATKTSVDLGYEVTVKNVSAASGGKHVIFNALSATLEAGDEVVIPAPYWELYPSMVKFCGGIPVIVQTDSASGYKMTPEQLEQALTPDTKWVFLNSPSNPSGAVYSRDELAGLAQVLKRYPKAWILSDDIYEHFVFAGKHQTLASIDPDLFERSLLLNGVSKAYSMTGWRLGWAVGPERIIQGMAKVMVQSTSNACSISQAATIAALTGPQDFITRMRESYQSRSIRFCDALSEIPGVNAPRPEGAFYALVDFSELLSKEFDDEALASALLHNCGIGCVPGIAFGAPGTLRFSFAAADEVLDSAASRIAEFVSKRNFREL